MLGCLKFETNNVLHEYKKNTVLKKHVSSVQTSNKRDESSFF